MSETEPPSEAPTYMDHYYLQFWSWACVVDAEEFLRASGSFSAVMHSHRTMSPQEWVEKDKLARRHLDLTKYHFVSSMGSLLRHLRRIQSLFPAIKGAWDNAKHLQKEGKDLRDMIEHADQYSAGKGRKQNEFVRPAEGVATNIPGDQPGTSDATGLIIDGNGHWLGGRLNVERILAEVRAISAEAEKIPAPRTYPFGRGRG